MTKPGMIVLSILVSCLLSACSKNADPLPPPKPEVEKGTDTAAKEPVKTPQTNSTQAVAAKKELVAYSNLAKSLLESSKATKGPQVVGVLAEELVSIGERIASAFSKKHAGCRAYLGALLAASKKLTSLSLDAIERDYHADGKLPKSPDDKCYHAKDLVVHPATVVILSRQGLTGKEQRDKATGEIAEVLAHLSDVERHL
ncbi:MAG: hypothetical protein VYA30_07770 [Myxococcota bacterium]|nr:hypothetical protein [Myxococcota bacterium]